MFYSVSAKTLDLCKNSEEDLFWSLLLLYYAAFSINISCSKPMLIARCPVLGELLKVHWIQEVGD